MEDATPANPELSPQQINNKQALSSCWRRLSAFIIDYFLLASTGAILGAIFESSFAKTGDYGSLVGYGIALLYFGILDSTIGNGKTVGKRLMKIEVVNREGNHIALWRSFLHFAIFRK